MFYRRPTDRANECATISARLPFSLVPRSFGIEQELLLSPAPLSLLLRLYRKKRFASSMKALYTNPQKKSSVLSKNFIFLSILQYSKDFTAPTRLFFLRKSPAVGFHSDGRRLFCFLDQLSLSHSIKIPAIMLTNNKEQILKPIPTGSLRSILPQYDTVIGIHQASGIRHHPIDIQPRIIKIFAAICKPDGLFTVAGFTVPSTAHPHFGQITASSSSSFPHFVQYFINTSTIAKRLP